MAVHNIECQIAKSQIGRYLSGDAFSAQALKQLEEHVAECDECKASLHQRKAALQAMLGDSNTAVVQIDEDDTTPRTVAAALREKLGSKPRPTQSIATNSSATKPVHFWKPLVYAIALGAVLIGMSVFSKTLTAPFGNKVEATPDASTTAIPSTTNSNSAATGSPATVTATSNPTTTPASTTTPSTTGPAAAGTLPAATAATPTTTLNGEKPAPILNAPSTDKPVSTDTALATGANKSAPEATPKKSTETKTPPPPAPGFTRPNKQAATPAAKPAPKAKAPKAKHRRVAKKKPIAHHRAKRTSKIRVYDTDGTLIASK